MTKESTFERIMLFGVRSFDGDTLSGIGKTYVVQQVKAIPIGLVAFLVFLPFCSLDISMTSGLGIAFACGLGGIGVLD